MWSRSFGGATFDRLLDVQCGSDGIYACGEGNGNILAVKADGNGDLVWTRSRDGGSGDYAKAMVLKSDLTGTTTGMSIVGQRSISSVSLLWRVDYQANGSFSKAQTLGSAQTPLEGHAIDFSFNFIGATSRYTISGIVNVAGEQQPFLLDFMDSESSTYGLRLTGANFVEASAFHPDGAGGYYLAGFFFDVSNLGAVMHLGSAGEYLGGFQLGAGGDQGARCYGLLPFQEGLLSWGKANSASQAWSALALSAQPFSQTWADNNGADAALSWSSTDSLGDSFIADDELTLDSGAGLEDAMASYLPLP
ncbi:hypothetical protein IT575_05335 [bacterium]|nr:hypothetical protein [bacterium]